MYDGDRLATDCIVGKGHLQLKGIDIDQGRPRVKFGKPLKSFRFYNLRTAANFYYMYHVRNNAGREALIDCLAREHSEVMHRDNAKDFAYVTPIIDIA